MLAVGLNPAWQQTMVFPNLRMGEVNRATECFAGASGKAVNFARAARTWSSDAIVAQFAGGNTGRQLCHDLAHAGIPHLTVRLRRPTRTCTTCLDSTTHTMTELIGVAAPVPQPSVKRMRQRLLEALAQSSGMALCGTCPPGVPPQFYAEMIAAAKTQHRPVMLDAWQEVAPALAAGPAIFKVNRAELTQVMGGDGNVPAQARRCLDSFPIAAVAVTDGPRHAWLFTRDGGWRLTIPEISPVASPLGAGDTVAAVCFAEHLAGTPWPQAFAAGLAAGSASCLTRQPAEFDPALARLITTEIILDSVEQ